MDKTPGFSEYKYEPLPSASSIRLLEVRTEGGRLDETTPLYDGFLPDDVIVCTIKTTSLDEPIKYDALSYSWGNLLTVFENKEEADMAMALHETKAPIICNGMIFRVGINLHDALLSVRFYLRNPQHTLDSLESSLETRPLVQTHIWIDAICINQNDIPERNTQVQIMDRIYSFADMVIIWLGPADKFSRPAVYLLHALCNAPLETAKGFHLSSQLDPPQYESLGLPQISSDAWLCLFAFFERSWFRRAWVVQEAALAKIGTILCGSLCLPWGLLRKAALWLRESLCYPIIWREGIMNSTELFSYHSGMYRPDTTDSFSELLDSTAISTVFFISDVRAGLGIQDSTATLVGPPRPNDFLKLLHLFRASRCQNPRDKI